MAVKKSAEKARAGKAAAEKPAAKKASPKKKTDAAKSAPASRSAKTAKAKKQATVSSIKVNLAHVLALRPRVSPSFRQADFLTARQLLQDEAYASIEEAARAVAEKALSMTHEGPSKRGPKARR